MAGVTVHLHPEDGEPRAAVLTCDNGESFIHVTIGAGLSLVAGRDHLAIASARALAAVLTEAADQLTAKLWARDSVPAPTADELLHEDEAVL